MARKNKLSILVSEARKQVELTASLPCLPSARLTGHQQLVNDVKFSPDTRIIASASFDKSIRLWSGVNGK